MNFRQEHQAGRVDFADIGRKLDGTHVHDLCEILVQIDYKLARARDVARRVLSRILRLPLEPEPAVDPRRRS